MKLDKSQLRNLYGSPSVRAKNKEMSELDKHAVNFIQKSPFLIISSRSKNGNIDASPRGGEPGFVQILNDSTIVIPDFKGNNRIDSLTNIADTESIGTLFLIPGVDETLRLNGSAYISNKLEYLNLFSSEKKQPITCIIIKVEEVFLHCAKAFMRSKLWDNESRIERSELPTMGQMLKDQLGSKEEAESQENMVKRYKKDL